MIALGPPLADDGPALGRILSDWIDETPWMPRLHSHAEDAAFVSGLCARTEVCVARDKAPLGFLALDGETVLALYVAAQVRGRGIGTALLRWAQSRRDSLSLWTFQANSGAQRFYARAGFTELVRTSGDNEEGLPDIRLGWHVGEGAMQ